MQLGIVSDIHGNSAALEKALQLAPDADSWLCLGDAINQYKFSNAVVALLRERCAHVILGNHEEIFFSHHGERARASAAVDRVLMQWLGSQPQESWLNIAGKTLHLIHSTPWSPRGAYIYPTSPIFQRFGDTQADVVLYGHTHEPVVHTIDGTLIINPGSVGEGRPTSDGYIHSFAVLDLPACHGHIVEFVP